MSGTSKASGSRSLEEEVSELRELVEQLSIRVSDLETDRVEGFELVEPEANTQTPIVNPASSATSPAPSSVSDNRTPVLKVIGSWLVHALAGRIVGRSGRERLPESSRVYLILQDSVGNPFNPALVCQSWKEAQRIVKPRGQLGSSVFIGLPSVADARIVCQETGVEWPEEAALRWIRPKVQKKSRVTRRLTW